jgi:hypothetical protein
MPVTEIFSSLPSHHIDHIDYITTSTTFAVLLHTARPICSSQSHVVRNSKGSALSGFFLAFIVLGSSWIALNYIVCVTLNSIASLASGVVTAMC